MSPHEQFQPFYPQQLEVCFSERCNLACDYCFVNKSSPHTLDFAAAKIGVSRFLSLPGARRTVTFNSSEPLRRPSLARKVLDLVLTEPPASVTKVVLTTNGLLLTPAMRDYLENLDPRFQLNLSWDGKPESHAAHRRSASGSAAACRRAVSNFLALKRKARHRVILTVAPSEAGRLAENAAYICARGFKKFDIFPAVLCPWTPAELRALETGLDGLVNLARGRRGLELRLLDRLWGRTDYSSLLLGSDGRFYLYEMAMTLPYRKRAALCVGDARSGPDVEKRRRLLAGLLTEARKAAGGRCRRCPAAAACQPPLPLFLWCKAGNRDYGRYLDNFCALARLLVAAAGKISKVSGNAADSARLKGAHAVSRN